MRLGLIGCGGIGQLRADAIAQIKSMELTALSDVDHLRAAQLAERYGGRVVDSWHQLLEDDGIDAVVVSTPPSLHAEMCMAALRAGKHVLCEKPLARTPDECEMILATAAESNCFLATGFNYRFYPWGGGWFILAG